MGGTGVSKSQVSRLCEEIDERVQAFLNRPIEGEWPYLWIDATYIKSRQGGRIVSTAAIVAVGANAEGKREVLGLATCESEAEPFWKDFLRSLTTRGLRGVKLVRREIDPRSISSPPHCRRSQGPARGRHV
jgi:putative transposase